MYKLFIILCSLASLSSCEPINRYFGLQDDNVIEEMAEVAIKMETGISVDLTPNSPEN